MQKGPLFFLQTGLYCQDLQLHLYLPPFHLIKQGVDPEDLHSEEIQMCIISYNNLSLTGRQKHKIKAVTARYFSK